MSSPIELLRSGISQGNWSDICSAFRLLTGENVSPPQAVKVSVADSQKEAAFDQIRQIVMQFQTADVQIGTAQVVEGEPEEEEEDEEDEDEAPEDPVSVRAREVRDKATNQPHRESTDKFKIKHKGRKNGDSKSCRVLPFEPGMTNTFKDDRTLAKNDIALSEKINAMVQPSERRPEVPKVKVECSKCHKEELVEPIFVPRKLDAQDAGSSYVCNGCIRKGS
jgi:hypothetical protein